MSPECEESYRAAVMETDRDKLEQKIDSARSVLQNRLLDIILSDDNHTEKEQIADALRTLEMISRSELQTPAS